MYLMNLKDKNENVNLIMIPISYIFPKFLLTTLSPTIFIVIVYTLTGRALMSISRAAPLLFQMIHNSIYRR